MYFPSRECRLRTVFTGIVLIVVPNYQIIMKLEYLQKLVWKIDTPAINISEFSSSNAI